MNKEQLIDILPHGSGINGSWSVEEKSDRWIASNFYEPMTEAGFYDGVADFTLIIPKQNPQDFKLQFAGREAQYLNRKHMLRDYLEDTFAYALESVPLVMSVSKKPKSVPKKRKSTKRSSSTPTSIRGMR